MGSLFAHSKNGAQRCTRHWLRGKPITAGHQLRTPLGCLLQHANITVLLLLLHHGERGRGRRARRGGARRPLQTPAANLRRFAG